MFGVLRQQTATKFIEMRYLQTTVEHNVVQKLKQGIFDTNKNVFVNGYCIGRLIFLLRKFFGSEKGRYLLAPTLLTMMSLCIVAISAEASAEARAPALVISAFIQALQKDDVEYLKEYVDLERIEQQSGHGYTIQTFRKLFESVQVKDIELSKPLYDKKTKMLRVGMKKPLSCDFELQHQNAIIGKGDFYRIVGIHPHPVPSTDEAVEP